MDDGLSSSDQPWSCKLALAVQEFPFYVRPEFQSQIGEQIEAELSRPLRKAKRYGVDPVGVPFVGDKGRAVSAPEPPRGERLTA